MIQQILKSSSSILLRRSICTSCYRRTTTIPHNKFIISRQQPFHSTKPTHVPIFPIPIFILGALKTGKLVSLVSLSSKTSLTLLPHTFRRGGKADTIAKILAGIPLFGFTLLLAVGLDQAPNTSRLRLIYLSEEEETEIVDAEINTLLESQSGLVAPKDSEVVMWLQTIVDNLAVTAVDDIRSPVRNYDEESKNQRSKQIQVVPAVGDADILVTTEEDMDEPTNNVSLRNFEIDVIWDSSTVNAMCAGSHLIVYNLLIEHMEYDSTRMAVILSHEIAHSIQRHFVEQHGFASLMFMLGDITRGVFWIVTESLGPYINQVINEYIATFITLETQTTYNRRLEKEADLVGLKILAKAGYDPRAAIDVWQKMADLDVELKENTTEPKDKPVIENRAITAAKKSIPGNNSDEPEKYRDLEYGVREFFESVVSSWFGSTHPPNIERIEYMQENMEEAVQLYNDALKLNGPPREFIFSEDLKNQKQLQITQLDFYTVYKYLSDSISSTYGWITSQDKIIN